MTPEHRNFRGRYESGPLLPASAVPRYSDRVNLPGGGDARRSSICTGVSSALECGFGDHEVGHLVTPDEIYCVVCLEEDGRLVRLERWEETDQARLRVALAAA